MKIILSRKGFDSEAGGYHSPIMPDGKMVSLPIPDNDSEISYDDMRLDSGKTYFQLMSSLKERIRTNNQWSLITKNTLCHPDPDIDATVLKRKKGWRGIFGQMGTAQIHLENNQIQKDDIFLFFGWFRKTEYVNSSPVFDRKEKDRHIIYGYLQIDETIKLSENTKIPEWMKYHPHNTRSRKADKTNTLYIGRKSLSWNPSVPGYGVFRYDEKLVLTKDGYSKSRWELPENFKDVTISYHNESHWKRDYFQSVARGQEFVIDADSNVINWAKSLINEFALTD